MIPDYYYRNDAPWNDHIDMDEQSESDQHEEQWEEEDLKRINETINERI